MLVRANLKHIYHVTETVKQWKVRPVCVRCYADTLRDLKVAQVNVTV